MTGEFHDLAESALNHESGGLTHWGNLGEWGRAQTYPQACSALADRLARHARLSAHTALIDVGFGCGDQLLQWIETWGVRELSGLNLSESQTRRARERLVARGHGAVAARLSQGSAQDLAAWAQSSSRAPADAVLALDCAYHFPSRRDFVRQAAQVLRPGGRLVTSDLVLARARLPWSARGALALMARLSHLPRQNLVDADTYQRQWTAAGFEIEGFEDLTPQVFRPFGDWLVRYRAALAPTLARDIDWTKYRATAAFLRWAEQAQVLRYVVCCGVRRADPGGN